MRLASTNIHREYARSIRGRKIIGEISGKRFARQSEIGSLFKGKFLSTMCFEGTCDTSLFNAWLQQMLTPNLTPGQVLIFKKASFHKAAESQKLVEAACCRILFFFLITQSQIKSQLVHMKTKVRELLSKANTFPEALDKTILSK